MDENIRLPLIGDPAPEFNAKTTQGDINFPADYKGKWVILFSHVAWLRTINEKIEWKGMKNVEVQFPVIEDISMNVAKLFGMVQPNVSTTQAVRAVFIIDPKGIVRLIVYYPASCGRSMQEIKRVIIAMQKADKKSIATPANWQPGDDVILPAPGSCGTDKERVEKHDDDVYYLDWFLCFRKEK